MVKTLKDKYKSFTVEHKLIKSSANNSNIVGFIKEGKANIDKPKKVKSYYAKTTGDSTVYYPIHNKRPLFYKIKGYLLADENKNEWVGYCDNTCYFFYFLLTGLALFITIGMHLQTLAFPTDPKSTKQNEAEVPTNSEDDLTTIKKGDGISNLDNLLQSNSSVKTLGVHQFSDLYITKGLYVPLINLPQNEILIMYEVYTTENELVFASKNPLLPNSEDKWYLDNYSKGDYEFIIKAIKVDENGNKGNSITFNTIIHIY